MKIPFDIKYRPQIESGEYKVETRSGKTARVICWDRVGTQLIVLVGKDEDVLTYNLDGTTGQQMPLPSDLFIITPEPELTEFEADVLVILLEFVEEVDANDVKRISKELLELAKKELCKGCTRCTDEYWRGRKEAMEEVSKGFHYEYPAIPTYFPSCFYGGPCTNPMHNCIICPRQSTIGINTTMGTSTAKVEG